MSHRINTQRNKILKTKLTLDDIYLQSQVTPTQTMMTQTTDDTPIIATRIITTRRTIVIIRDNVN